MSVGWQTFTQVFALGRRRYHTNAELDGYAEDAGPSPSEALLRRAARHRGFQFGLVITLAFVLLAMLGPVFMGGDPYSQHLDMRLLPLAWQDGGTWAHPLGTDQLGRDYFTRLIYGARVSLMVGFLAAAVSAVIGSIVGIVGGYFGGRTDSVVVYLINVKLALPGMLVALSLVAAFGGSMLVLILVLTFLFWDRYAVVLRSLTQRIRTLDYVTAARANGAGHVRIVMREILPNVFNQIIVIASLEVAIAILLEAALSFLGLGIQPPTPSWGIMIAEGRNYMFVQPSLIFVPGLAIFALVVAINMLGDGLRDISTSDGQT